MKIITLFNHKGGVAKTTNVFNLAWKLAERGSKVLMVDADSQCNLTGISAGLMPISLFDDESTASLKKNVNQENAVENSLRDTQDKAEKFWSQAKRNNLHAGLSPVFRGEPRPLEAVECLTFAENANLFLLPGSIDLASYDSELSVAHSLMGTFGSQINMPGAIYALIQKAASKYEADYVVVDVSPSLGAINQNLVCISDLVIIPCAPDYFSVMALNSLASILPQWKRWAEDAASKKVLQEATYPFNPPKFRFGGIIVSRYVTYKKNPATAFASWINRVVDESNNELLPQLDSAGILYSESTYSKAGIERHVLAQIREFNSLRPKSQQYNIPPFALTEDQLRLSGTALENSMDQVRELNKVYDQFAARVELLP